MKSTRPTTAAEQAGTYPTAPNLERPKEILVRVGRSSTYEESDGAVTLRMEGVEMVELSGPDMFDLLNNAGIPRAEAMRYADEIVDMVYRRELARLLADRIARVG